MDITQFENRREKPIESVSKNDSATVQNQIRKKIIHRPMSATVNGNSHFPTNSLKNNNVSFAGQDYVIGDMQQGQQRPQSGMIPVHPQSAKSFKISPGVSAENEYYNPRISSATLKPNASSKQFQQSQQNQQGVGQRQQDALVQNLMGAAQNVVSLKKLMPKNIKQGKEALYEGALQVKEKCNKLENENMKLKTQAHQLERQNNKLKKLLFEIEESQAQGQVTLLSQPAADSLLILTLKKEQQKLHTDLKRKEEEIRRLKLSTTQTRIVELEIQLEQTIQQYLSLKIRLDNFERFRFDGPTESISYTDTLRSENAQLRSKVIRLEDRLCREEVREEVQDEIYARLEHILSLQQKIETQDSHITGQQKKIDLLEEELQRTQSHLAELQAASNTNRQNKQTERQLLQKMEEKDAQNQELQEHIQRLQHDYNELEKKSGQEKLLLKEERNAYKKIAEDKQIQQREKQKNTSSLNLIQEDESQEKSTESPGKYVKTLQEIEHDKEAEDKRNKKRQSYKQVVPVSSDQLQTVKGLLKFKLELLKISFEDLAKDHIFTSKIDSKGSISILELIQVFSSSPFSLDEDDSENLARFLVEDNLQDVIKLRMTMEADNVLVRSRLRFLLGSIRVFTQEEETAQVRQLAAMQVRYGEAIYSQLSLNNDVRVTLQASKEQVCNALAYLDIDLTKDEIEYYFLKLFERTQNPDKFNLDDCCKLFINLAK